MKRGKQIHGGRGTNSEARLSISTSRGNLKFQIKYFLYIFVSFRNISTQGIKKMMY